MPNPDPTTATGRCPPPPPDVETARLAETLGRIHQQELELGARMTLLGLRQLVDTDHEIESVKMQIEAYLDDGVGESASFHATYGEDDSELVDVSYWTAETVREAFDVDDGADEGRLTRQQIIDNTTQDPVKVNVSEQPMTAAVSVNGLCGCERSSR